MSGPTDISAVPEHDSHSDSDWLDIASTDRDSDDNDSIYSSKETDHEDLARSRSRRSSLSYGSSRDGDVDAWEGLIDDSADEGMPNDVLAPNHHVQSVPNHPATFELNPPQETFSEELRVKEGLDQSMISTLSSSRSSSLHASTLHTSSRDLRLSFPDPITSSCREPLSTSYEPDSETLTSSNDSDVSSRAHQADDEEMLSASQTLPTQPDATPFPSSSGPELRIFLYGFPTSLKWSIVNKLLQKVAHGAGLTIASDLDNLQGSIRRLTVSGSSERDHKFPHVITIFDRTLVPHDDIDDPALTEFSGIRPLAVVFLPSNPLYLPEHVLHLLVKVSPSYLGDVEKGSLQDTWDPLSIPSHQILRITKPQDPIVIGQDSIDIILQDSIDNFDSTRVHRVFTRLWTGNRNVQRGPIASTHALTIIAILSLVLGVIVRAAIPISLFVSPTLTALNPNYTSGCLWQMLRPAPYRERLPPSTTSDSSVVAIPSASKEFSLSIFSTESTSIALSRVNPTNFRRVVSSTFSERLTSSKDLMLQSPRSLLLPEKRPKALSVIPDTTPTTYHPGPAISGHPDPALVQSSIPSTVQEYASVAFAIVNQDLQDVLDALEALAQAISRQTRMILKQATTFVEQSAIQFKGVESFEAVKDTLHAHNERARKRAREIKERGTKWLYDASEVITTSAEFSKGMAWEVAEGLAHRAQRARGKAKQMVAEVRGFVNEYETLEALGMSAWEVHLKHWDEWMETVGKQGRKGKSCKHSRRKLKSAIFC